MDRINLKLNGNNQQSKVLPMVSEKELSIKSNPKNEKKSFLQIRKLKRKKQYDLSTQTKTALKIEEEIETKIT